jgi:DNA-binding NarL/FixJ family response regulator
MKTQYKILWIDDEHRYVRGDKRSLKGFLSNYGVELIIEDVTVTPDECPTRQKSFIDMVSDLDLDMAFIDFNMPEQGNEIIKHIRKNLHHYYLPILFYTSDGNAQETLQQSILTVNGSEEDAKNIADGIYFCDRDHIAEKAQLILSSLLKKESRPQQTRGLLMDRVSEIDANIAQCIKKLWSDVPKEKREKLTKTVNKRLGSKAASSRLLKCQLKDVSYDDIPEFIEENKNSIDTAARAIILRETLKHVGGHNDEVQTLLEFFQSDDVCLNALRNGYAHETELKISETHDDDRCKFIREESRRHLNNVMSILAEDDL